MIQTDLPNDWFCKVCRPPPPLQGKFARGMLSHLRSNLEKKNPISFRLPKGVRGFFVDVKTGPEGEYDEGATAKPK